MEQNTDSLTNFIDTCIERAYLKQSHCTLQILSIPGMCGETTRHLYNNICSLKDYNLLEIGCWKGASTIAAAYNNNSLKATIIDDWSEFGGPRFEFTKNISKYIPNHPLQIINEDCFRLKSTLQFSLYNIFIYDGPHNINDHENAITSFWKYLSNICIIVVDDWKWNDVKQGTLNGLKKVNAHIVRQWELKEPIKENKRGVWNGCCIFLINKNTSDL